MKGVVFNILEDVVTAESGEHGWDDLLDRAGVDAGYTAIGNYADAEFVRLLHARASGTATDPDAELRRFGLAGMRRLVELYPDFFTPHLTTIPFLLTLNDIIHPAVRCLYPGADVPVFDFAPVPRRPDGGLVVGYRSRRRLCHLAAGFIEGVASHYGEQVVLGHEQCMHHGAPECVIVCAFSRVDVGG